MENQIKFSVTHVSQEKNYKLAKNINPTIVLKEGKERGVVCCPWVKHWSE
jgi:hypothetical protein